MDAAERDQRALRLIENWVERRRRIMSGETPEMHEIAVELMDLFPRPTQPSTPSTAVRRLAEEADAREARRRQLAMALDTLSFIPLDQVEVERNPLYLDDGESYLDQCVIKLPEVSPGEGEHYQNALRMLITVATHRRRDRLTDTERLRIGWADRKLTNPRAGSDV